jgi:hypothetical protein
MIDSVILFQNLSRRWMNGVNWEGIPVVRKSSSVQSTEDVRNSRKDFQCLKWNYWAWAVLKTGGVSMELIFCLWIFFYYVCYQVFVSTTWLSYEAQPFHLMQAKNLVKVSWNPVLLAIELIHSINLTKGKNLTVHVHECEVVICLLSSCM